MIYSLLRRLLFQLSPEAAHHFSMEALRVACDVKLLKNQLEQQFQYKSERLHKTLFGLKFENPVGLAAGFDKNALYLRELETLGFGFVEIGTVTPLPQGGNEKPRLFRLPADKALINRMGFNNEGVKVVANRLKIRLSNNQRPSNMIVGGNIGKNKQTPNDQAWKDYEICFKELFDCVDYFVVNVSSPNTPGLRELQEKESLGKILSRLQNLNNMQAKRKPLLLKIAPDLTESQLAEIVELAFEVQLDGLVAANTTISREGLSEQSKSELLKIGPGGLSGLPLKQRATRIVEYLSYNTQGKIPIIASGGIFNGNDAKEKLHAGASLVQVWTGFIYEGPGIAKSICKNLADQGR